ncbi:MAG: hypothetical protein AAFW67_12180, partial [Cyanobacteria bacterium J06638_38]
ENLVTEQKWEELVDRKVSQVEEQYKLKLDKAGSDYAEVSQKYNDTTSQLTQAEQRIDEMERKFIAYDSFISNKGKPDSFKYVWDGDLRDQTKLDGNGDLQLLKARNSEDVMFDDEGNIVDVNSWMQKFRKNGGGNFFDPITDASGTGSPPPPGLPPSGNNKVLTIASNQLGDVKVMKAIAAQLEDGDVSKAIADGRVVVKSVK